MDEFQCARFPSGLRCGELTSLRACIHHEFCDYNPVTDAALRKIWRGNERALGLAPQQNAIGRVGFSYVHVRPRHCNEGGELHFFPIPRSLDGLQCSVNVSYIAKTLICISNYRCSGCRESARFCYWNVHSLINLS